MEDDIPVVPAPVAVRVEVERSGGFAGLTTRRVADTADLAPEQAQELRGLVAGAALAAVRERLAAAPAPGGADRFQYDVTVHEGEQVHRFSLRDGAVPAELAPILAAVAANGRPG